METGNKQCPPPCKDRSKFRGPVGKAIDEMLPRCRQLENEGRFGGAVDLLSDAIQMDPSHIDLLLMRGRIRCERMNQAAEAINDSQAALELDPSAVAPHQY